MRPMLYIPYVRKLTPEEVGKTLREDKAGAGDGGGGQSMGATQFLFVSSAGIYDASVTPPLVETDAVKFTSGHAEVEP